LLLRPGARDWGGREEGLSVGVSRVSIEGCGIAVLHYLTVIEHYDALRDVPNNREVVRYEQITKSKFLL
jgi:hypothetical protein